MSTDERRPARLDGLDAISNPGLGVIKQEYKQPLQFHRGIRSLPR